MLATLRRNRPLLITLVIVLVVLFLMARRFEPKVMASVFLSGLTLGALYFLVASGLSLIFGLMDVLNFAQGAVFMIGAYLGFTTYANPRLILNVLPFALAILGGVQVGRWLGGLLPARFKKALARHFLPDPALSAEPGVAADRRPRFRPRAAGRRCRHRNWRRSSH